MPYTYCGTSGAGFAATDTAARAAGHPHNANTNGTAGTRDPARVRAAKEVEPEVRDVLYGRRSGRVERLSAA